MRNMIAYCGLDCEKCDAYLATIHDDQELREKTAKLWAEQNHAPILPEHINCEGCRVDGIKTVHCDSLCGIRQCALKKGVTTCGDCSDLERCQTVGAVISNDPDALKNLNGSTDVISEQKGLLQSGTVKTVPYAFLSSQNCFRCPLAQTYRLPPWVLCTF